MGEQQTIQDAEGPLRAVRPLHLKDKISVQYCHSLCRQCRQPVFVNELSAFVFLEGFRDEKTMIIQFILLKLFFFLVLPPRFEGSCGVLGG